jgi:hypothetical protein
MIQGVEYAAFYILGNRAGRLDIASCPGKTRRMRFQLIVFIVLGSVSMVQRVEYVTFDMGS